MASNAVYALQHLFVVAGTAAVCLSCAPIIRQNLEKRKETYERLQGSRERLRLLRKEIEIYCPGNTAASDFQVQK